MDLSHLNLPQQQAVQADVPALLVLAGAGTGKTSVITHRIAHFVRVHHVEPRRILAVTFTNKAAREMRERASKLVGVPETSLDIGTFHRMCGRLLRRFAHHVGLEPSFVIYDGDDQLALLRRCIVERRLDPTQVTPRAIRARIEDWKNKGQNPADVSPGMAPLDKQALEIYQSYQTQIRAANAVDFTDMLLLVVTLLKQQPTVLEQLRRQWSHLLVDEYQDTNHVQHMLLKLLATPQHSLTVVGDDDQSIYRWRGADVGNILRFERDFPGAQVIRLEQNYRSTATILAAANGVIAHNASRKGKTLFCENNPGARLTLRVFDTERDEGNAVAESIATAMREGLGAADIAILYRTNAQSRPLEDALRRHRIPYKLYGGVRFYDRKEIKDALAYLRLLASPRSTLDFLRVVNTPARGIGKSTLDRLSALAASHQVGVLEAARLAVEDPTAGVGGRARVSLAGFLQQLDAWRTELEAQEPLGRLLEHILQDSQYLSVLQRENTPEATERLENLRELVAAVDEYTELQEGATLTGFLEDVALATDVDNLGVTGGEVALMTLHAAKGLEFPMVFLPGMEEGLFPHSRSLDDRAGLEEERRLCYVGITRAKQSLTLTAARVRNVFGRPQVSELSRFVEEIPAELVDAERPRASVFQHVAATSGASRTSMPPRRDFTADATEANDTVVRQIADAPAFGPGTRVLHATFGEGQVLDCDGTGSRQKLTIQFPSVGKKVIVARFVQPA